MNIVVPGGGVRWRSRTTFVLALSAAAVGFGNVWRFSYLSGEHGGAPFVLLYIVFLLCVAVPVLVAEVVLGSRGRADPLAAIGRVCEGSGLRRGWLGAGVLACFGGLLLLSLYSVVAGWSLAWARHLSLGTFSAASLADAGAQFAQLLQEPEQQVVWQSLFLLLVVGAASLGVRRGLGLLVWLAVPALLALLGTLVRYSLAHGDVEAAREFLFTARPMDFTPRAALAALGHAFYTLGVGVAVGVCYGAYAPRRLPVGRSVLAVAIIDTAVALFAGLAVFPLLLANHMEPAAGPGLLFVSLPHAFGNLPQGETFGTLFFLFVAVAALGSAVAVLEPLVALLERRLPIGRATAALLAGSLVWLIAYATAHAFQPDAVRFGGLNLFEWLDRLATEIVLPLAALLVAVFVGWRMPPRLLRRTLVRESAGLFRLWRFLLRVVVPPAIVLLLLTPRLMPLFI